MSYSQQEIAAPRNCRPFSIYLLPALIAVIITAVFGVSICVFAINETSAMLVLLALFLLVIPLYFCIKARLFAQLAVLLFYLGLTLLLSISIVIAYSSLAYAVIISTAILLFVSLYAMLVNRNNKPLVITSALGLIMAISIVLMLFFLNADNVLKKTVIYENRQSIVLSVTALGIVIIALITFIACMPFLRLRPRQQMTSRYMTYAATFVALSVLCKTIGNSLSFIAVFKFSFVYVPWVLSGMVLGPVGAMVTAGMSDLIGQLIVPTGGAPNLLILLSNTLMPLFPALVYRYLRIDKRFDYIKIFAGMFVSMWVCTMGISTYALAQLYQTTFAAQFVARLPQMLILGINYIIIVALIPVLYRTKITKLRLFERKAEEV